MGSNPTPSARGTRIMVITGALQALYQSSILWSSTNDPPSGGFFVLTDHKRYDTIGA